MKGAYSDRHKKGQIKILGVIWKIFKIQLLTDESTMTVHDTNKHDPKYGRSISYLKK